MSVWHKPIRQRAATAWAAYLPKARRMHIISHVRERAATRLLDEIEHLTRDQLIELISAGKPITQRYDPSGRTITVCFTISGKRVVAVINPKENRLVTMYPYTRKTARKMSPAQRDRESRRHKRLSREADEAWQRMRPHQHWLNIRI